MENRGSSVVDVQRYLIKDERVVWSAQPVRKFFLKYLFSQDPSRFLGYYFIVFGLVFALMPLLVFVSMPTRAALEGGAADHPLRCLRALLRRDGLRAVVRETASRDQAAREHRVLPHQREGVHRLGRRRSHGD